MERTRIGLMQTATLGLTASRRLKIRVGFVRFDLRRVVNALLEQRVVGKGEGRGEARGYTRSSGALRGSVSRSDVC